MGLGATDKSALARALHDKLFSRDTPFDETVRMMAQGSALVSPNQKSGGGTLVIMSQKSEYIETKVSSSFQVIMLS